MTKRVKQHQLEDYSRSKYSLSIPKNWVMRDKDKDYGIDAEIEIFDENDRATGLVYWVQLKATSNEKSARVLDLKIDTVRYYKQLDLPVLIVRYSEKSDRFFCKWAHEIDQYYAKKDAKTIRVSFGDADLWGSDSAAKTTATLRKIRAIKRGAVSLPVSVRLIVEGDSIKGVARGVFMSAFRLALQDYSRIAIYENVPEKAALELFLSDSELVVSLSSVTGCTFHNTVEREGMSFPETVVMDSLLGFAVAMAELGQIEVAATIFLDKSLAGAFLQWEDLFKVYIPQLIRTSRYGELIDAVCDLIDANMDNNTLENITVMSVIANKISGDEDRCNKLQELLDRCLQKYIRIGEKSLIGSAHYNLANHFRSRSLLKQSVHHYLLARRNFPAYLKQIYFYRELGGALFELGKYRFSSNMYKRALEMGASSDVKPLYADALMFGGQYQKALDVFSEYVQSGENEMAEWELKAMFLTAAISKTGIGMQDRRVQDARSIIDVKNAEEASFAAGLDKAFELDLLCGLAWFNLGILKSKQKLHEEVTACFVACGLVQTWDIEAWVNATLSCFNHLADNLPHLVITTAYNFHGDRFISMLHERLADSIDSPSLVTEIVNLLDQMVSQIQKQDVKPALRFFNKDGLFKDVSMSQNA